MAARTSNGNPTWSEVTRQIRARIEDSGGYMHYYAAMGLTFHPSPKPNSKDWIKCWDAAEKDYKSDAVNTKTGTWHDFNGGATVGFFDYTARHYGLGDFEAGKRYYAKMFGIPVPGGYDWVATSRPLPRLSAVTAPPSKPAEPTTFEPLTGLALKASRYAEKGGRYDSLSRQMGLSWDSLYNQGVGCWPLHMRSEPSFGPQKDKQTQWLEWQRQNGKLEVCTINRRYDDPSRRKQVLPDRPRGMILSDGWERRATRAGVLFVPEGGSDVAGCDTLGLGAIGYPSSGSVVVRDHVCAEIVLAIKEGRLPANIRIVVTQDLDDKGRLDQGCLNVAQWLADATGLPAWVRHMPRNPGYVPFVAPKPETEQEAILRAKLEDNPNYVSAQWHAEQEELKVRPRVYKDVRAYVQATMPNPNDIPDDEDEANDYYGTRYEEYGTRFITELWGDSSQGVYYPHGVAPSPQADPDGYYWANGEVVFKRRVIVCDSHGEEPSETLRAKLLADVAIYELCPEAVEVIPPSIPEAQPKDAEVYSWFGGQFLCSPPPVDGGVSPDIRLDPRNWGLRLRPDAWSWMTDAELKLKYPELGLTAAPVTPAVEVAAEPAPDPEVEAAYYELPPWPQWCPPCDYSVPSRLKPIPAELLAKYPLTATPAAVEVVGDSPSAEGKTTPSDRTIFITLKTGDSKKKKLGEPTYDKDCPGRPNPKLGKWCGKALENWYLKANKKCSTHNLSMSFGHRERIHHGVTVAPKCYNWSCVSCHNYLRWMWSTGFRARLREIPPHGRFYVWTGPEATVSSTLRKRINELDGQYACVATGGGNAIVITTVKVAGSKTITPKSADAKLIRAIKNIVVPADDTRFTPISSSKGWKKKKPASQGKHELLAKHRDLDQATKIKRSYGVEIGEIDPMTGVAKDEYPNYFTANDRRWACMWAAWQEMPPKGWELGDPVPDAEADRDWLLESFEAMPEPFEDGDFGDPA